MWVVRGGKANAVIGAPTQAYVGGGSTVEFLTSSGEPCGSITLPAPSGAAQIDFGRDGTAFVLSVGQSITVGHQLCTYRWWPNFAR